MQGVHRDSNIDNLRRDPIDGAYHCPKCNAPFTRRSNLRRHYHIHTRNVEYKCRLCNEGFRKSVDLESHTRQCTEKYWDTSAEHLLQAMANVDQNGLLEQNVTFNDSLGTPSAGYPGTNFPDKYFSHINLFSPMNNSRPQLQLNQESQDFNEFLSSLSTFSDESSPTASSLSSMSPIIRSSSLDSSTRRPSSSSSLSSNSSASGSSPFIPSDPLTEGRRPSPSQFRHAAIPDDLTRGFAPERPIYTRRQVEDMLNVVSNCFIGTIDAVIQRADPPEQGVKGQFSGSQREIELRRLMLSEALPRLLAGLQDANTDFLKDSQSIQR